MYHSHQLTRDMVATPSLIPSQLPIIVIQASTLQWPSQDPTFGEMAISSTKLLPADAPVQPANTNSDALNVNGDDWVHLLSADIYTITDFGSAGPDDLAGSPSLSLPAAVVPTSTSVIKLKGKKSKQAIMKVSTAITAREVP